MARPATSVTIDSAEFNRAVNMLISTSKRSRKELLEEQGKMVVMDAAHITPPNKSFKSWNKKGGVATIKNDLARLFKQSSAKGAEENLEGIHRASRGRRGRVRKGVDQVKARGVAAYRKTLEARVGRMAAGWKQSARKLGGKLPQWITRHNSPGYVKYTQTASAGTLEMTNAAVYASQRGTIEKQLPYILRNRAKKMMKRVNFYLAKMSRKSGFKFSR